MPENLREHKLFRVEQDYNYIITYTREDLKDELIDVAESASLEEVCMTSLMPMEMNRSLRNLLDSTFEGRGGNVLPDPVGAVPALTFVAKDRISLRTRSSTGDLGSRR